MRIVLPLLMALLGCFACKEQQDHKGKTPLVEVEGSFLYKEDLDAVLPMGLSAEDSLLFAQRYIRSWAEDVLLYEKAADNIPRNVDVAQLVENYRKALVVHTYQQELISQQLAGEIPEEEIATYYEDNKHLFRLESPIIKGLYIKVPLTAPQLANVRRWYKAQQQESIEKLEKYSFQHAVGYEYFYDKWVPAADILELVPLQVEQPEAYVAQKRQVELKDTAFYYFLHVSDYRAAGEEMPYEFAHAEVRDILTNQKRVDFMEGVKADLYRRASEQKRIKYKY